MRKCCPFCTTIITTSTPIRNRNIEALPNAVPGKDGEHLFQVFTQISNSFIPHLSEFNTSQAQQRIECLLNPAMFLVAVTDCPLVLQVENKQYTS